MIAADEVMTQKFFKGILEEEIDLHKEPFSLSLINYDITDDEVEALTLLNDKTIKLTAIEIRLSYWLTDEVILGKFFRKLFKKKQFVSLGFYINELSPELFPLFIDFLSKINYNLTYLAIRIKYKSKEFERDCLQKVFETLLSSNHGLTTLDLSNNFIDTPELMDSLRKLLAKKTYEEISINLAKVNNCVFDIDLSQVETASLMCSNLNSLSSLPLISLDLSLNNISKASIHLISENLSYTKTLKTLNLSNNYIGDSGCEILSKGIALNQSLTTLNLASNYTIDEGVIAIAQGLLKNTTISKLDFKKNYIRNNGLITFCSILMEQPKNRFEELDFTWNAIEEEGFLAYGEFLSKHSKCKTLSITSKKGKDSINDGFSKMKSLSELTLINLYSMDLNSENMAYVNEILLNNTDLQQLILSNNKDIQFTGISHLSSGLERNKNLTHLFLSQCNISDEGCVIIANALFNNISIKELHLDYNSIGVNGSRAIGEKVIRKRSLTTLNLEHNLIDHQGAYFIGKYLEEAYGIQSLSLNSNPIGDEGCVFIANGIKLNNTLNSLNLNNIQMTNKGIRLLSSEIVNKLNITHLNVSSNQITEIEEEFYQLFNWMSILKIADNPISPHGIVRIFRGSENNHLARSFRLSGFQLQNEVFSFKTANKYLKRFDFSYTEICVSLIRSLLSLPHISLLDIRSIKSGIINDEAVGKICTYITENQSPLKKLYLQSNAITGEGALYIAELLNVNTHLVELNIADNNISSEGIKMIFQALTEKNNTLKILNVNYCGINEYASREIYNMLVTNTSLISLSLHGNLLTDRGVDKILSSFRLNKTLKLITIGNNLTTDKALKNIDQYLIGNKTLRSLEMKTGKLAELSMKKMAKVLMMNHSLRIVNFVHNNISYKSMCKLCLSIEKNENIHEIKLLLNGANDIEQNNLRSANPHIVFH